MIIANACPRCRGALSRIIDVGETYYSCVQCGYAVYGAPPRVAVMPGESRWQAMEPADRSSVRRRLIAKERAKTGRRRQAA